MDKRFRAKLAKAAKGIYSSHLLQDFPWRALRPLREPFPFAALFLASTLPTWGQEEPVSENIPQNPAPMVEQTLPPQPTANLPAATVADPSTEILSWSGNSWHISNNRLFRSRFERFLNAPEENSKEDAAYALLIDEIMAKLAPAKTTISSIDQAFSLLAKASGYPRDANLSDAIANQVYSVWLARRADDRLTFANRALEEERRRIEWNMKMTASAGIRSNPPASKGPALIEWSRREAERQKVEMQPLARRLSEITALLKIQGTKREISLLQTKIEFQALILQLFLQRRFEHVLISTRFYRNIFADGDQQIKLGKDSGDLFARTTGLPPTVTTVDTIANEAMQDTAEGVKAFEFLVSSGELDSASNRLAETFILGEHLQPIRTLARERKRRILEYYRKSQDLITALDVRSYDRAAELVTFLEAQAGDFDPTRAKSAIKTASNLASMHLAKAKNAAAGGDNATFEAELKLATAVWPTNPALEQVASQVFERSGVQQSSLVDFDQLAGQRNHRRIFEEQARFIAATIDDAKRQDHLQQILTQVRQIDSVIAQAQVIESRGDVAGAWEMVDRASRQFPEDSKLNSLRSILTTKVPSFVSAMEKAKTMEDRNQIASSLAWYLNARKIYPRSEYAREGIRRLVETVMPDAS